MKPGDLISLKPEYQARYPYNRPQPFLIVELVRHYAVVLHPSGIPMNIFLNNLDKYQVLSEAG